MAQTRTITPGKRFALAVLDAVSRPLSIATRAVRPRLGPPKSFLILELWGMGDVVLTTPLLRALRRDFPGASITILGKRHASDLLAGSGLADEVIEFDFPWTSFRKKWDPARYSPAAFRSVFRTLRAREFDVCLDARRDIRNNIVAFFSGARQRIGFDFGGGAHLLTDVVPGGVQNDHKIDDWLSLLRPLGVRPMQADPPLLAITDEERFAARARLWSMGVDPSAPVIGVHPGASNEVRRWRPDRYGRVVEALTMGGARKVILFDEPGDLPSRIPMPPGVPRFSGSIREMMALLTECDLLVCADSGPMHIAGALGVPVIALFGPQRQEWYGPRGPLDRVVQVDDMPCRPCFDKCRFATVRCMDGIAPDKVITAALSQLERLRLSDH